MVKFVKKRDGSIVPFEKQKIINAIGKAGFVKEGIKEKIDVENLAWWVREKLTQSAKKHYAAGEIEKTLKSAEKRFNAAI